MVENQCFRQATPSYRSIKVSYRPLHMAQGRCLCGGSRGRGVVLHSALPASGAPVLVAAAGSQQCLQSHLHECLEVIASLPSAVLLAFCCHLLSDQLSSAALCSP